MDEKISSPDSPTVAAPATEPAAGRRPGWDRSTRRAALFATLIAVPVTVAVAGFTFAKLSPDTPTAAPSPSATSARPQSTAPVEMAAPALAARPAVVCRALVSQLPDTVRDLRQRPVTAGPEQNAAYGDPALTVSCGGARPAVGATDEVYVVNKVCWHPREEADATVLTALDREVPVTVRVPRSYGAALQWVPPLSDTIVASVPSGGTPPAGCRG
ncbi:DUF3515 family protein [Micromonospora sp. NPDC000089]|uniref:DUF3515 family protein n=1 Tax=unclassified Micromonospora TaxID=2617518 RepID=UPI003677AFF3